MFVTTTVGVGSPGISRDGGKRASWLATAHCQTAAGQGGQRRTPPPVWLPKPSQSRFALLNARVTLLPHEGFMRGCIWKRCGMRTHSINIYQDAVHLWKGGEEEEEEDEEEGVVVVFTACRKQTCKPGRIRLPSHPSRLPLPRPYQCHSMDPAMCLRDPR